MQIQPNTLFANRYQFIKLLGRGGFSEVWLANDNWTHLQIAVKVYAPGQGMAEDGLRDFCGELARVYELNHSNLLKPQHVDFWNNMPYLVMAYCPAGSCVTRIGKMSETELWKLIHDVAAGLAYLHEKDIVHQDIKPDNILIDAEGNYLITDFGISTHARSTLRKSVMVTTNSAGTLAYMGPERFSQQPAPTKASDIWSFGAMLFELLEGTTPFPPDFGGSMQNANAVIPTIQAHVSDKLKQTIYQMLSKETWDRPTAATLIEWANNPFQMKRKHIENPQPPTSKKSQKPTSQSYKYWILGIIVAFCVGVGIFIINENEPIPPSSLITNNSNINTSTTDSYSGTITQVKTTETVDQDRVEGLLSDISKYSSKGGDYAKLENCFTDVIYPHPSGKERFRADIAQKTKDFVEYYPKYVVSVPYNVYFQGNTFPVAVECDVFVTWKSSKTGSEYRAKIHKIYYVTLAYKVSGFKDQEVDRIRLN